MLTAATGIVDAVSILRLGRVFVANMTGNTAIELVLVVLATVLSAVSPASRTVVVAVPVAALLAVAMGYRTPWRAVWPYPISPPRC